MPVRKPLAERFWSKVDKRGPDDCWLWTASRYRFGYGKIGTGGHGHGWLPAHRVAWELTNGPVTDGLLVLHRCDNPPCVNPSHLFLGTNADNLRDMAAKGRNWQQRKTHCPHGHEYTEANTYRLNGHRYCRACNRAAVARLKAKRMAA